MKKTLPALLLAAFLQPALATDTTQEIEHLLNFVASSGCSFERNGNTYDAIEARAHIERKYDYIKKRIHTTEEFIRYAASESSISGKKYHATCNGETLTSEKWLNTELQNYRKTSAQ